MSLKKYVSSFCLLFALFVLINVPAQAQSALGLALNYVDSTNFPEVRVYTTVSEDGKPVTSLTKENFALIEGGYPVTLSNLSSQLDQMFVVLVLDTTGSMLDPTPTGTLPINILKDAAISFTQRMPAQDLFAVYSFNDRSKLECNFTTDRKTLTDCINNTSAQSKDTALWTSAIDAINKAAEIPRGRRAVVLFTDGDDNLSKLTVDDVIRRANDSDIPVFIIAAFSQLLSNEPARLGIAKNAIDRLSTATRAQSLTSQNYSEMPQLFDRLAVQLKSQYVLEYTSNAAELRTDLSVAVNYKGVSKKDVLSFPVPAVQAAIPPLVSQIDVARFPDVKIYFSSPTLPSGVPITPTITNFLVQENGSQVTPTGLTTEKRGTLLQIIVDTSTGLSQTGATQQTVWKEISDALLRLKESDWLDPNNKDSVSLIASKKDATGPSFSFTSDYNRLHNVAYSPKGPSAVVTSLDELVRQGLDEFKQVSEDGRRRMMVVFSTGISAKADTAKIQDAALLAKENNISVFIVYFGSSETTRANAPDAPSSEYLKKIASLGNWRYYWFTSKDAVKPVFQQISNFGRQYGLPYRSKAAISGNQQVRVAIRGANQSKLDTVDQKQYQVNLALPQLEVSLPTNFVRNASAWNSVPGDAQPKAMPVGISIAWPDGHARSISKLAYQFKDGPERLVNNPPADAGQIAVDIKDLPLEDRTYSLLITVQDELGLTQVKEVLVPIKVVFPPTAQLIRVAVTVFPVAALIFALVMLVAAVYIYKTRPVIYQNVAKKVKEITESFRRPGYKDRKPAKAYLIPISGDDVKQGIIEIRSEITRLGRDETLANIVLIDTTTSQLHSKIVEEPDGGFRIYDEGSRNGTYVNDEECPMAGQVLHENDRISIARDVFQFKLSMSEKEKTEIFSRLGQGLPAKDSPTEVITGPVSSQGSAKANSSAKEETKVDMRSKSRESSRDETEIRK